MKRITIHAENYKDAEIICATDYGFFPEAIREIDSGEEGERSFVCFESSTDAVLWDKRFEKDD